MVFAGKYLAEGVLGIGGMGMVIAAKHLELDQRVEYDDEPVYDVDEDVRGGKFTVGATVVHQTLGYGRVVAVTGSGRDQKVTVDFGTIGQKTVVARYLSGGDDGLN